MKQPDSHPQRDAPHGDALHGDALSETKSDALRTSSPASALADAETQEADKAQVLNLQAARSRRLGEHTSVSGLRILLAVDSRFPGLGGAESQALKLALALREQGAEVEFATPRVLLSQSLVEEFHGFTINRIDYPHVRWVGSLVLMVNFARYLINQASRFDAVHIHIAHLLAAAAGFSRSRCELPITTKISGFYEFEGGVLDSRQRFKPLNFLLRLGLKRVDYVQTISHQTREKLLESGFLARQIKFIPNGVDTNVEPIVAPAAKTLRIGYCGRLREVKGVHVLLEAFANLHKQPCASSTRLVIAGSGDTQAALMRQAQKLGIEHNIDWLGLIDDTADFFRGIDIYVQPSFAEGLPNSVMEAMVEQRPVIATDVGGNADLVQSGETGLLFPVGDSDALTKLLKQLIDDPSQRDQLAKAGRQKIVRDYGFDSVIERLSELYRGL